MPPHKEVKKLEKIAMANATNTIISICKMLHVSCRNESSNEQVLSIAKNQIRPYWISIPGHIRENILELCWKKLNEHTLGEAAGRLSLYLLAILLAPDIRNLKVNLCCYFGCYNQVTTFHEMIKNGHGLYSLDMTRPTILRLDSLLLELTLSSMTRLVRLILNNIATDEILRIIAISCPNLQILDVEHSKQVTDRGITNLLLKPPSQYSKRRNIFLRLIRKLKRTLRHAISSSTEGHLVILKKCLQGLKVNEQLTKNLQHLRVGNTRISIVGVLYILLLVPNLRSLGKYSHIDTALLIANQIITDKQSISDLRIASCTRPSQYSMRLLSKNLPNLETIVLTEPKFTAENISLIKTVKCIHFYSAPASPTWIKGLKTYLKNFGISLRQLTIKFTVGDYFPAIFDISVIIDNCPNLQYLVQDGGIVEWENFTEKTLLSLEKMQLGKIISRSVLVNVLTCVPNLRTLHIFSCDTLLDSDLMVLVKSKLQCLYIANIQSPLSNQNFVQPILKAPHLKHIGNLSQWSLTPIEQKFRHLSQNENLNIKFTYADHWFSSSCFPLL